MVVSCSSFLLLMVVIVGDVISWQLRVPKPDKAGDVDEFMTFRAESI